MKLLITLSIVFGVVFLSNALTHNTQKTISNIILNGDFSLPYVGYNNDSSNQTLFEGGITGWDAIPNIQVKDARQYNGNWMVGQAISLDPGKNTMIYQKMYGLFGATVCRLEYLWAASTCSAGNPKTAQFVVLWNGTPYLQNVADTEIHFVALNLTALADRNTLAFMGLGPSDGCGASISKVQLLCY